LSLFTDIDLNFYLDPEHSGLPLYEREVAASIPGEDCADGSCKATPLRGEDADDFLPHVLYALFPCDVAFHACRDSIPDVYDIDLTGDIVERLVGEAFPEVFYVTQRDERADSDLGILRFVGIIPSDVPMDVRCSNRAGEGPIILQHILDLVGDAVRRQLSHIHP